MLFKQLILTASYVRDYLDAASREQTIDFILSRWNRDGGVQGRSEESDLYYTGFAAMALNALGGHIPRFRLWCYLRTFGDGASLDVMHLFCLTRLHLFFPMTRKIRGRLHHSLMRLSADSAADVFLKVLISQFLKAEDFPEVPLVLQEHDSTSNLAAAVVVNYRSEERAEKLLLARVHEGGGFCPTATIPVPNLAATLKALYALRVLGTDLSPIRASCLNFIESLRCEDGGYLGFADDDTSDVENTFYALFSIGCLMADVQPAIT